MSYDIVKNAVSKDGAWNIPLCSGRAISLLAVEAGVAKRSFLIAIPGVVCIPPPSLELPDPDTWTGFPFRRHGKIQQNPRKWNNIFSKTLAYPHVGRIRCFLLLCSLYSANIMFLASFHHDHLHNWKCRLWLKSWVQCGLVASVYCIISREVSG